MADFPACFLSRARPDRWQPTALGPSSFSRVEGFWTMKTVVSIWNMENIPIIYLVYDLYIYGIYIYIWFMIIDLLLVEWGGSSSANHPSGALNPMDSNGFGRGWWIQTGSICVVDQWDSSSQQDGDQISAAVKKVTLTWLIHSADCAVRSLREEEDEEPIQAEVGLARERAFHRNRSIPKNLTIDNF